MRSSAILFIASVAFLCVAAQVAAQYGVPVAAQGGKQGSPCSALAPCANNLFCDPYYNICTPNVGRNSYCQQGVQCNPVYFCRDINPSTGVGECKKDRTYGGNCIPSPPPPFGVGGRCVNAFQCFNSSCQARFGLNGGPCNTADSTQNCQSNLWCKGAGSSPICASKLQDGTCSNNVQCSTNSCSGNDCYPAPVCTVPNWYGPPCNFGLFCNNITGVCEPLLAAGDSCTSASQCFSNVCLPSTLATVPGSFCAQCTPDNEWDTCAFYEHCITSGPTNVCIEKEATVGNNACLRNSDCLSNLCINSTCTYSGYCINDAGCKDGWWCNQRVPGNAPNLGTCTPPYPLGSSCSRDWQCNGKVNNTAWCSPVTRTCTPWCTTILACPTGWICPNPTSNYQHDCLADLGTKCLNDAQCAGTNFCSATTKVCTAPAPLGGQCTRTPECAIPNVCLGGVCSAFNPWFCKNDAECPGVLCNLLTHQCQRVPGARGAACVRNAECGSSKCGSLGGCCGSCACECL